MNENLKLIIDNWSQIVVLLGAIGFIIGQSVKWIFKKKEIKQTVFLESKYKAVEHYMDRHTTFVRLLNDLRIGDIVLNIDLDILSSIREYNKIIESSKRDLENATNRVMLYFNDSTYSLFEKATCSIEDHNDYIIKLLQIEPSKRVVIENIHLKVNNHLSKCVKTSHDILYLIIKDLKKEFN